VPAGAARPAGPVSTVIAVVLLVISAGMVGYLMFALLNPERF
jgi:K+-transporting ATPase KdpF subunit